MTEVALRGSASAFIAGRQAAALSGATFETINPATGDVLAEVAECRAEDVDVAVAAARQAFDDGRWSRRSPESRKETLLAFADLAEQHAEALAVTDALEAGKPISDCRSIDIPETIRTFRWYAEAADKLFDAVAPTGPEHLGLILREPIGVVGAVLPWNFPALMFAWKAAPALAAGNSIVIKPAEQTSLSALRLAELAAEAGLPDGVLSVVPGYGDTAGRAIGVHMDVDAVSFTGSTEVGRLFLEYAASSNLKEVVLECGGKSPQVVMGDAADLDVVADEVTSSAFWNMGENCSCGSRLVVHSSIKDALLERVVAASGDWKVGDPLDEGTKIGPLIEEQHYAKVMGYVDGAEGEGAAVVLGGQRVLTESGGYFLPPTIIDGVGGQMRVARDEIFGPVVSVIEFSDEAEAIAIANDTNYGLAASLWTRDVDTAFRVGRGIRAGTVSVNCYSEGDVSTPFGGYKLSGFGGRDNGLEAFDQYTQKKTLWFAVR
jgi:4-(gamma-glutamylamino)butanal dehydrogenase